MSAALKVVMNTMNSRSDDAPIYERVLKNISQCHDISKLTTFAQNARKRKVPVVEAAALERVRTFIPICEEGSYADAFWKMFLRYQTLLFEHGKPMLRLNKAWKMALEEGEIEAHRLWIDNGHQVWALQRLIANGSTSLSAEGLALKFGALFENETKVLAERNLKLATARMLEKQ